MKTIPKEILDRLTFLSTCHTEHAEPVIDIKPLLKACEDCGLVCDRRQSAFYSITPFPHWKHKCDTCKMYRNPDTGQYDLDRPTSVSRVLKANQSQDDK